MVERAMTEKIERVERKKAGVESLAIRQGPSLPKQRHAVVVEQQQADRLIPLLLAGVLVTAVAFGAIFAIGGDDSEASTITTTSNVDETTTVVEQTTTTVLPTTTVVPTTVAPTTTAVVVVDEPVQSNADEAQDVESEAELEAGFVTEAGGEGAEQTVTFRSTTVGNAGSIEWDFGDGNTATGPSVIHNYILPGTYAVRITARNTSEVNSRTQNVLVDALSGLVEVGFTAAAPDPAQGQTIKFTNISHEDFGSFAWNFGDGGSSTGRAPRHVYSSAGDYTVTVTGTMADGQTSSVTYSIRVAANVQSEPEENGGDEQQNAGNIEAGWTTSAAGSPNQQTLNFESLSRGNFDSLQWDFGDGNTGTGETISHTYAESGRYSVTITATNAEGQSDSTTHQVNVQSNG